MVGNIYFDDCDRALLAMVNTTVDKGTPASVEQKLFNSNLHPHGIINLATSHDDRMAYAVINLLKSLEGCKSTSSDRLTALKALYDEVINSAQTPFRLNTGRVLIQIMKDIVRARGNEVEQLKLIHDFRNVMGGNPRIVRGFLLSRKLVEVPESWDQLTMDQHVHDSNTKGRKNPTYLIMDAWIKGIRSLTVVYYNYIDSENAHELLAAAEIMNIKVRIGLEYRGVYRNRYTRVMWVPRGFSCADDMIEFIESAEVKKVMAEGKKASEWVTDKVYEALENFKDKPYAQLQNHFGLKNAPELTKADFKVSIGRGQASVQHLCEYVHKALLPSLEARANEVKGSDQALFKEINEFTLETLSQTYFSPTVNSIVSTIRNYIDDDRPKLLKTSVIDLLKRLTALRSGYRTSLQLADLSPEDVLQLLWDAHGMITHIERFNMKSFVNHEIEDLNGIGKLQTAINTSQVMTLKDLILLYIDHVESSNATDKDEQLKKLHEILENIPKLLSIYAQKPLGSTFGTDSTSHLDNRFGMGLAVEETLPGMVLKKLKKSMVKLPVSVGLKIGENYSETEEPGFFTRLIRRLTGNPTFGMERKRLWEINENEVYVAEQGNIITLGGAADIHETNGFEKEEIQTETKISKNYWKTTYLNIYKVLFGLIPAFITFNLTQHCWLLAFFGAPMWLGITGIRNIIQMVIASGSTGTRIHWYECIQWKRLCESLMFTGWSVVLLEGITRNCLIVGLFGIDVTQYPLLVFTIIAMTNGIYISSHNIYRGFPLTAVVGNLFRSILAIPVAMIYNAILAFILPLITTMPAADILIMSSAIITKFASDTIALMIEATADRRNFYRIRHIDYTNKLTALFSCVAAIEAALPKTNVMQLLETPKHFIQTTSEKVPELQKELFAHLLDLMYFWYYQYSSHQEFNSLVKKMNQRERECYVKCTRLLNNVLEVSEPMLQGILGENINKALAFYVDNFKSYIAKMNKLFAKYGF